MCKTYPRSGRIPSTGLWDSPFADSGVAMGTHIFFQKRRGELVQDALTLVHYKGDQEASMSSYHASVLPVPTETGSQLAASSAPPLPVHDVPQFGAHTFLQVAEPQPEPAMAMLPPQIGFELIEPSHLGPCTPTTAPVVSGDIQSPEDYWSALLLGMESSDSSQCPSNDPTTI